MDENDHRHSIRVRSFLRGEIVHSNGNSRTECTVRDLSDTGARVDAPPSVTVPEFFELHIPQRNLIFKARIARRQGQELGLIFETPAAAPAPSHAAEETPVEVKLRMLELETEVLRLRAQLSEMKGVIDTIAQNKKTA
jgi:hypothetical protein